MKKIILTTALGITLSMNAVITNDEYFDSAIGEGNRKAASALYHVLEGKEKTAALKTFKRTFGKDENPAGGGVDIAAASKEFQDVLKGGELEKIAALGKLFEEKNLSGYKAIDAVNAKAKNGDAAIKKAVADAKVAAIRGINRQ